LHRADGLRALPTGEGARERWNGRPCSARRRQALERATKSPGARALQLPGRQNG